MAMAGVMFSVDSFDLNNMPKIQLFELSGTQTAPVTGDRFMTIVGEYGTSLIKYALKSNDGNPVLAKTGCDLNTAVTWTTKNRQLLDADQNLKLITEEIVSACFNVEALRQAWAQARATPGTSTEAMDTTPADGNTPLAPIKDAVVTRMEAGLKSHDFSHVNDAALTKDYFKEGFAKPIDDTHNFVAKPFPKADDLKRWNADTYRDLLAKNTSNSTIITYALHQLISWHVFGNCDFSLNWAMSSTSWAAINHVFPDKYSLDAIASQLSGTLVAALTTEKGDDGTLTYKRKVDEFTGMTLSVNVCCDGYTLEDEDPNNKVNPGPFIIDPATKTVKQLKLSSARLDEAVELRIAGKYWQRMGAPEEKCLFRGYVGRTCKSNDTHKGYVPRYQRCDLEKGCVITATVDFDATRTREMIREFMSCLDKMIEVRGSTAVVAGRTRTVSKSASKQKTHNYLRSHIRFAKGATAGRKAQIARSRNKSTKTLQGVVGGKSINVRGRRQGAVSQNNLRTAGITSTRLLMRAAGLPKEDLPDTTVAKKQKKTPELTAIATGTMPEKIGGTVVPRKGRRGRFDGKNRAQGLDAVAKFLGGARKYINGQTEGQGVISTLQLYIKGIPADSPMEVYAKMGTLIKGVTEALDLFASSARIQPGLTSGERFIAVGHPKYLEMVRQEVATRFTVLQWAYQELLHGRYWYNSTNWMSEFEEAAIWLGSFCGEAPSHTVINFGLGVEIDNELGLTYHRCSVLPTSVIAQRYQAGSVSTPVLRMDIVPIKRVPVRRLAQGEGMAPSAAALGTSLAGTQGVFLNPALFKDLSTDSMLSPEKFLDKIFRQMGITRECYWFEIHGLDEKKTQLPSVTFPVYARHQTGVLTRIDQRLLADEKLGDTILVAHHKGNKLITVNDLKQAVIDMSQGKSPPDKHNYLEDDYPLPPPPTRGAFQRIKPEDWKQYVVEIVEKKQKAIADASQPGSSAQP